MKKVLLLLILIFGACNNLIAANLIQVFQLALKSDPDYQQTIIQTLSKEENINLSRSALLPNISLRTSPEQDKLHSTGSATRSNILPPANDIRSLDTKLSLTQTIFNFAQAASLSNAKASARQANATLNAAAQNLMLRVAKAYFNVLMDEDNLAYYKANMQAFSKELSDVSHLYKLGSKTQTDVYTAQSAYGSAETGYITAETQLATDREFLITIIGENIGNLAKLNDNFPLISPQPADQEAWVNKAKQQNWTIKANEFAMQAARELIKQQYAGHLPTLSAKLSYEVNPTNSTASSTFYSKGASKTRDAVVELDLNVPIYSGGAVVSQTKQAQYSYQIAQQQFEASCRNTIFTTRQSYLNIMSDLQKLAGDKEKIISAESSLKGLQVRYKDGSGTLLDVLNQQEKVLQAKSQFATDRYSYIINLLTLKNAAGILSAEDLVSVNSWLKK